MRGDPQTASVRSLPVVAGRRWSSWTMRATLRRTRRTEEQLERAVRRAQEHRRALQSREYLPGPGWEPWRLG